MGLALGMVAGAAAALLTAPMRGTEMRERLRSGADNALERGTMLLEQGRRAFRTRGATAERSSVVASPSAPFSATLGEIAQMHSSQELPSREATS
jgi:gas vesicle protein